MCQVIVLNLDMQTTTTVVDFALFKRENNTLQIFNYNSFFGPSQNCFYSNPQDHTEISVHLRCVIVASTIQCECRLCSFAF